MKRIKGLEQSFMNGTYAPAFQAPTDQFHAESVPVDSFNSNKNDKYKIQKSTSDHSGKNQDPKNNTAKEDAGLHALYHLYCLLDITTRCRGSKLANADVPLVEELITNSSSKFDVSQMNTINLKVKHSIPLTKNVDAVTALPSVKKTSWKRVQHLLPRLKLPMQQHLLSSFSSSEPGVDLLSQLID